MDEMRMMNNRNGPMCLYINFVAHNALSDESSTSSYSNGSYSITYTLGEYNNDESGWIQVSTRQEMSAREAQLRPSVLHEDGIENGHHGKVHTVPHSKIVFSIPPIEVKPSGYHHLLEDVSKAIPLPNGVRLAFGRYHTMNYVVHPRNVEYTDSMMVVAQKWRADTYWLMKMTAPTHLSNLYFAVRSSTSYSHIAKPTMYQSDDGFIRDIDTSYLSVAREQSIKEDTVEVTDLLRQETFYLATVLLGDLEGNVIGDKAKREMKVTVGPVIIRAVKARHQFDSRMIDELVDAFLDTILFLQALTHTPIWALMRNEERVMFSHYLTVALLEVWLHPSSDTRHPNTSDECYHFLEMVITNLLPRATRWLSNQIEHLPHTNGLDLGHIVSSYLCEKKARCSLIAHSNDVLEDTIKSNELLLDAFDSTLPNCPNVIEAINGSFITDVLRTIVERTCAKVEPHDSYQEIDHHKPDRISEATQFLLLSEIAMSDHQRRDEEVHTRLGCVLGTGGTTVGHENCLAKVNELLEDLMRTTMVRTTKNAIHNERHFIWMHDNFAVSSNVFMRYDRERHNEVLEPSSALLWYLGPKQRLYVHRMAPLYGFHSASFQEDPQKPNGDRLIALQLCRETAYVKAARASALDYL